jgi:hypothetical protein
MKCRTAYCLAIALIALCLLTSCAASRTDTTKNGTKDRTTVTKETRIREGTDPFKETVYREEVSKEVAQSEQSRTLTIPAIEGLGSILGGMTTGNPILDIIIAMISAQLGGKGLAKVADKVTGKKKAPSA